LIVFFLPMSLSRFYLAPADWQSGDSQVLGPEEGHHCVRVLRRRLGEAVELFDGAGRVAQAVISEICRELVTVQVESIQHHPPLLHQVHLLPALIKGEAFEWLLEKAVELGAASVQPVATTNSVVQLDAAAMAKKTVKWQRQMLEAAKQCHTPFLPVLLPPLKLMEALASLRPLAEAGQEPTELRLIPALTPGCGSLLESIRAWPPTAPRQARTIIGPEGDFTAEELAEAQAAGFQPVTLGPLILRAETATLTALALLTQSWGE
jgi:16S rRNA (uracil1498-N3)-methyltransferase